jgi:Mycothiol maleylpyruvate isomerase N-terminal domain
MNDIRSAYLHCYTGLRSLALSPELSARWEQESCLPEMSVRSLAGHLIARTGGAVLDYLDADLPVGVEPIDAPAYYATVLNGLDDQQVRVRGEEAAPDGANGLLEKYEGIVADLGPRLEDEPSDRLMKVFGGLVMRMDDYLVTRICEILVHADDLAISLDMEPPEFPQLAWDLTFDHLLEVARMRHGDNAVLMSLTRRERDGAEALRIF